MPKAKDLKEDTSIVVPDTFCCYYGAQPFFSSSEKGLCEAVAAKRKAELIHSGVDIQSAEHAVEVRTL
mgnify:CR=1 FL=1